jgi:hypothetical protein
MTQEPLENTTKPLTGRRQQSSLSDDLRSRQRNWWNLNNEFKTKIGNREKEIQKLDDDVAELLGTRWYRSVRALPQGVSEGAVRALHDRTAANLDRLDSELKDLKEMFPAPAANLERVYEPQLKRIRETSASITESLNEALLYLKDGRTTDVIFVPGVIAGGRRTRGV